MITVTFIGGICYNCNLFSVSTISYNDKDFFGGVCMIIFCGMAIMFNKSLPIFCYFK